MTFAPALRSNLVETKRHREVIKHRNEPKRQKTMSYENVEECENHFVSHDQLRDA